MSKLFVFSMGSLLLGYFVGICVGAGATLEATFNTTLCAMGIR